MHIYTYRRRYVYICAHIYIWGDSILSSYIYFILKKCSQTLSLTSLKGKSWPCPKETFGDVCRHLVNVTTAATDVWWVEARDTTTPSAMHRTFPSPNKELLDPKCQWGQDGQNLLKKDLTFNGCSLNIGFY